MIAFVYVLTFLLEAAGLIRAFRFKRGFGVLVLLNLGTSAAAAGIMRYYDQLAARNSMTGWAYFPEVFSSLCAAAAFGLLGLLTAALWLIRKR